VAEYGGVEVRPLAAVLTGFAQLAQPKWVVWRERQLLVDRLPVLFAEALGELRLSSRLTPGQVLGGFGRRSPAGTSVASKAGSVDICSRSRTATFAHVRRGGGSSTGARSVC
jgi:hypothetical protein